MSTYFDDASLVMIPSGYKDDKLYSIKPTSGDGDFTFSRDGSGASPATRVNSAGLIEKGRTNLLVQSNSFDTTWLNSSSTETSGQSGYDGTNDAWLLSKSAASGRIQQSTSTSGVQTFSAYLKAGTYNWGLLLVTSTGGDRIAYFDLANGVVGTAFSSIDSNIESVGNGWYRCSINFNATTTSVRIYPALGDTDLGTSGSIYIQDAQLEKGLVATSVIETTTAAASAGILGDMPRLDYSGGASCPSLLLEPSRTNLLTQSEYFNSWSTAGTTPVFTNNYGTSPEGLQNSTRVQLDNSDIFYQNVGLSQGAYVFSVFAKAISGGASEIILRVDIPSARRAVFDLSDGTIVSNTADDADIIDYGNGWYRCILIQDNDTIVNAVIEEYSNSLDCEIYGAQLESGSYPTSYVPTYGSATARAQDQAASTGLTSTLNSSEGVLYAELKWTEISLLIYLSLSDGTNSNRVILYRTVENNVRMLVQVGGVTQASLIVTQDTNEYVKVAVKYKPNDFAIWVNGTERGTDTSGSTFSANTLNKIGFDAGLTGGFSGSVKQVLVFNSALTDVELAALTTI